MQWWVGRDVHTKVTTSSVEATLGTVKSPEPNLCTTTAEVKNLFVLRHPSGLARGRIVINTQMHNSCTWTHTETHSLHPFPCKWQSNTWLSLRTENLHNQLFMFKMQHSHKVVIQLFVHCHLLQWCGKSPTWTSSLSLSCLACTNRLYRSPNGRKKPL